MEGHDLLCLFDNVDEKISYVKTLCHHWYDDKKWYNDSKPPKLALNWVIFWSYE
ncbi:hypothetical protein RhiirA4_475409 [Rhizophagus irregularis]|uniref:Uncharacterized protein n=1 Tax=Rhizophagus irregularis TaxID=588596 RepID=A0A2I1HA41_9GLOM|nr:hypothetical protein RhiirA4_475409 [Rhizophagus irregularis]